MLLWRIGANAIPTKVNLQHRIQQSDTTCSLCNSDEETYTHLFFQCPFAKALWTIVGWGLKIDSSSLASNEDIIKLITNPPKAPIPTYQHWTIPLNMALIFYEIWKTRNHLLFQGNKVDLSKAMSNARTRFLKAPKVYSPSICPSLEPSSDVQTPPSPPPLKVGSRLTSMLL